MFLSCFFKVMLRMLHAAKRRSTKIFEWLGKIITRLVKLNIGTDSVAMDIWMLLFKVIKNISTAYRTAKWP